MDNNIWAFIITSIISLGALIVSITSICISTSRENSRKLKDVIIEEIANLQRDFLNYLTPLVNGEAKYSGQETISWFKFAVGKIEAINAYIIATLSLEKGDIEVVNKEVQSLRSYLSEAESFLRGYNDTSYKLSSDEILEVQGHYANIYKAFLANIATVNAAKCRKNK